MVKLHADHIRVALAFPNTYHVGMSNLGFQAAYRLFNAEPDVACERAFLPGLSERRGARSMPLVTVESGTPAGGFDVLAFSVSFEWDYPNVVTLLRMASLPVYASERSERHPLVVVGGAVSILNPEPLAPFVDVFACGDGEVLIPRLAAALRSFPGRRALLSSLSLEDGFYIPSFYEAAPAGGGVAGRHVPSPGCDAPVPVTRAVLRNVSATDPPATSVFTPDTEFGARFLVEAVRGCPNLCRFCWAGYNYLPVRAFQADRVLRLAREARVHAGRAGLVSLALGSHPELSRILAGLRAMDYAISPASLRIEDITPGLVQSLVDSGERTITIAPEAGSDRLRRVLGKKVTGAEILDRADMAFAGGIENLKLYFMVGLPTETDDDIVAIRELTVSIRDAMLARARSRGRAGRIIASVNPFVPKPGTPFQWLPMERPQATSARVRRLRALVAGLDNVHFTIKSERQSHYQALLSLGDRRLAPMLAAASRYDGDFRRAVAETGVDLEAYVFRERPPDEWLPWDIVSGGPRAPFLRCELERTLRDSRSNPGGRRSDSGAASC